MMPLVSVLFISYRRFPLLERTVRSFCDHTCYPNLELIVTDDGSPSSIQRQIRELPISRLILSEWNRGMAANANAGLRECKGDYVLFLQDDWECHGPESYLQDTVEVLESHPQVGLLRLYGVNPSIDTVRIIDHGRDLFQIERPVQVTDANRHIYSDTPHVKSKLFMDYLGEYDEKLPMEECEREYQDRFLKQSRFNAAYFPRYMNTVFKHIGEAESFRTNSRRARFERRLQSAVRPIRHHAAPAYRVRRSCYRASVRCLYRHGAIT